MIAEALLPERMARLRAWPQFVWRAWRTITVRSIAMALAFAAALVMFLGPVNWYYASSPWSVSAVGATIIESSILAAALLASLPVADAIAQVARRRWLPYVGAACVAAAVTFVAFRAFLAFAPAAEQAQSVDGSRAFSELAGVSWIALLATMAYAQRRWSLQGQRAVHAAQLEQAELGREAVALRLKALQARIDPRLLFDTMARVEALYAADVREADRLLDDMIVFLRAALPGMQHGSSTAGTEAELAKAYLAIRAGSLSFRLRSAINVPQDARDARMPPMVMVPILDFLLAQRPLAASETSLDIDVELENHRLRITIGGAPHGGTSGETEDHGIETVRERLRSLYGDAATLELQGTADGGTTITLELPHERTDRDHR